MRHVQRAEAALSGSQMRPEQTAEALVERQTLTFKIRLRDNSAKQELCREHAADFTRQALATNSLNGTQRFQRDGFVVATARAHRKRLSASDLQKFTNGAVIARSRSTASGDTATKQLDLHAHTVRSVAVESRRGSRRWRCNGRLLAIALSGREQARRAA
jgi:hypothetical protein